MGDNPELVRKASAETYIKADSPPFLIQHGTQDVLIPVEQSIAFAAALEQAAGTERVTLDFIEDAGHGGPAFEASANIGRVLDFLDRHLSAPAQ
ncbi:alpha/beta hydrolase family protein [Paenibacillus rhizovicinus]|uniref:alpha/beta hydrolase family protein n=1 Tax=Paenibacillus rhizovicinus TaxID=2704463 RepID=UPI001CDCD4F7